jgi:hypothetical protein
MAPPPHCSRDAFTFARPLPPLDVFDLDQLKTQPELVRYYHAAASFPTKPSWLKTIKNKQYT